MSSRYLESELIKRENRRGERTLPWVTPVLKVILALPTFDCGSGENGDVLAKVKRNLGGFRKALLPQKLCAEGHIGEVDTSTANRKMIRDP